MRPFFAEIGRRVCELNEDRFYTALELRDCGDLADLLIIRAAAKLEKPPKSNEKRVFE